MATQQDIYAAGSENRPPMLSKEQRHVEADYQAIHILLLGLLVDVYAVVDSCENAHAMWLRVQRTQDPFAFFANTLQKQQPYPSPVYTLEQPLPLNNIIVQQPLPNNNFVQQQPFMDNIIDVNNPMQSMQTTFALMSNAFKKHYFTPTNNQMISSNTRNKWIAQPAMNMNHDRQMQMVVVNAGNQGNRQMFYNCKGLGHYARDCANRARVRDSTYYNERLTLVQQVEAEIPLTAEQHDFLVVNSDEEWEEGELNANCIFMTKLRATSTNTDNNHVYDTVTPYEVLNFDNYYDNRIYNMFSHEEQHSELPESSQGTYVEQHYDSNIMVETIDVDFSGGDVKQYAVNNEETNAYCETLLNNFKVEIDRCLKVNHKDKAVNERLTVELTRENNHFLNTMRKNIMNSRLVIGILFMKKNAYSTLEKERVELVLRARLVERISEIRNEVENRIQRNGIE
ncbi:ribonuclease H-like domain-containing protein [Tanacetum coccineum]